jgi:hypothetical protein
LSRKTEEPAVPATPFPIWVPTLTGLSLNPFLHGKRSETKHQSHKANVLRKVLRKYGTEGMEETRQK